MRRWFSGLTIVVILAVACTPAFAQTDETDQIWELIKQARTLANDGDLKGAEEKLLKAKEISPEYADLYAHLGYVYELQERPEDAVHAYCELLRRRPRHEYARTHLNSQFYENSFPRWIIHKDLQYSPVSFVLDRVLLSGGEKTASRQIAYTRDLLFHEDMKRGGDPVEVEVPASGGKAKSLLNRSTYGFVSADDSDRFILQFILNYRSKLVSPTRSDYTDLAPRLMHILLRAQCYFDTYLGKTSPVDGPTKVYLLEQGPPGAEAYHSQMYLYSAQQDRPPLEWAREVAHEYGHLVLPAVGRYVNPEDYASGLWGERLFIQWLAEEAQTVAMVPWPDESAQKALSKLWADDADFNAASYLADTCYTDMGLWYERGPDSPQIAGTGEQSMHYWLGFMTWVQAAFGKEGLRETVDAAPGTSPADFMFALKQVIKRHAEEGKLAMRAGCLDAGGSELSVQPLQGALRWRDVQLKEDDTARFVLYLPARPWRLLAQPSAGGLELIFDDKGPFEIDPGDGVSLGRVTDGWHTLQISCTEGEAALDSIELLTEPEV